MTTTSSTSRAKLNGALTSRLGTVRPLIAVHRGTGLGMIHENTTAAVRAAVLHGADIVEIRALRYRWIEASSSDDGFEGPPCT